MWEGIAKATEEFSELVGDVGYRGVSMVWLVVGVGEEMEPGGIDASVLSRSWCLLS